MNRVLWKPNTLRVLLLTMVGFVVTTLPLVLIVFRVRFLQALLDLLVFFILMVIVGWLYHYVDERTGKAAQVSTALACLAGAIGMAYMVRDSWVDVCVVSAIGTWLATFFYNVPRNEEVMKR